MLTSLFRNPFTTLLRFFFFFYHSVKKGFAFFKDAENCPLPKHQIRIESFVKRINMALKLENGNNELSPQHMYILGHPDLFTDPDRSYLEKQHFTFFDTAWRNRQCTFTDSDGNLCGNDVGEQRPEVRNIPYERPEPDIRIVQKTSW